jgi:hypothetical protein
MSVLYTNIKLEEGRLNIYLVLSRIVSWLWLLAGIIWLTASWLKYFFRYKNTVAVLLYKKRRRRCHLL